MSEQVWRLRVGLNVAALSCRGRGRASVTGPYGTLLKKHRALLETVYKAEQSRIGARNFDRVQTSLYNRFANQRSPEKFCSGAQQIAKQAASMNSRDLVPQSRGLVSRLERLL